MKSSLGSRIFRTFFTNSLISLAVVILFVWFVFEDMEDNLLIQDSRDQLQLLRRDSYLAQNHFWQTENIIAFFQPHGLKDLEIPDIFRGITSPFSAEVEWHDNIYYVFVSETDEGIFFLAKNVNDLERREYLFGLSLALLCLIVLILNFMLAIFADRHLVKPLHQLTHQIRRAIPSHTLTPVETDFSDTELVEIAQAFNWFIVQISALIQRERTMISLAGHELKTPIAIIAGALEVIEQRNDLSEADRITFNRIKKASQEMQENIETLLTLSRRSRTKVEPEYIVMDTFLDDLIDEIGFISANEHARIERIWHVSGLQLSTDIVLAKLLIRNLVRNALNHTKGTIQLQLTETHLDLLDRGPGLPPELQHWLQHQKAPLPMQEGLGLFLVSLACEQLGWHLEAINISGWNNGFRLIFKEQHKPHSSSPSK